MILLTGASGFIGKHLLRRLIEKYGKENILALTSKPIVECQYLLHENYSFDKDYFIKAGFASIETIIHLGAFTPKDNTESNNWKKCNSNITNTECLLNADFPSLNKVLYISTLDVYAPEEIISEQSNIRPISLYGSSKLYCEEMVEAWTKEYNKGFQLLRIGHVYGPGEEVYEKIIPLTIKRIINNQPILIYGEGREIRSFINIHDVVEAIINAMNLESNVGPINLVGGQAITIAELVNLLIEISDVKVSKQYIESNNKSRNLVFNNDKMKKYLLPNEMSLTEGLLEEWKYMKQKFA